MYACMYVCMYVCVCIYIYIYIYIYRYTYTHMCIYIHVYTFVCICIYNVCVCVYLYLSLSIYIYMYRERERERCICRYTHIDMYARRSPGRAGSPPLPYKVKVTSNQGPLKSSVRSSEVINYVTGRTYTVSYHDFDSHNFKLRVSNPISKQTKIYIYIYVCMYIYIYIYIYTYTYYVLSNSKSAFFLGTRTHAIIRSPSVWKNI